jgi:hypothetical protein
MWDQAAAFANTIDLIVNDLGEIVKPTEVSF